MRVFLYEHVTAGGMGDAPPPSLLAEGLAMLSAVAEDLGNVDVQVLLMEAELTSAALADRPNLKKAERIRRVDWSDAFTRALATTDATLIIAPETDRALLDCVTIAEREHARLLGPTAELVELCMDKAGLAEELLAAGVPAPRGRRVGLDDRLPEEFPWPAVLKPCDGAGSQDVRLLTGPGGDPRAARDARSFHLEPFYAGRAVSVSVLCGPGQLIPLPACAQHVSSEGFEYLGGSCPIEPTLNQRAQQLALAAVTCLPGPRGYLGVDMVLGEQDVVLEINPRLTTSYTGLRVASSQNLALSMLSCWTAIRSNCQRPRGE